MNTLKTTTASLVIGLATLAVCSADAPSRAAKTDKTLVAWVAPANLTQRGGSALTIQSGDQFDAIVLGELQPGKWMAGSNYYGRTEKSQEKYPAETADSKTIVQLAIVYQGDQISIYRNGKPYASHSAKNIDLLSPKNNIAVFGLRHVGAGTGGRFCGAVEDARIYAKALTLDEIKSLRPNERSEIEPYAWWDFEGDKVEDRSGRFAHSKMDGGAKLDGGKLVLGANSVLVAAASEADAQAATRTQGARAPAAPYVPETPAMPENVPDNWLTYHLGHPGPGTGFPGDPNCAFFYKGLYHLHYIYRNRYGFVFAHVSSKDMVTWRWHPTVLVPPATGHGMFSGTGFFTKEGRPAIIYHGQGSGRNQLAFALDDNLDKWTRPVAIYPKTESGEEPKMRHWDPDCWLRGDTYYAISGGGPPYLIRSSDLKDWVALGVLLHEDMPDLGVDKNEDVSCANMFKIGDKWMLLCISHRLGCRYYLGDFKGEKYLPEFHAMMNWNGWDFFAPESLLAPDGRRIMWAWCNVKGAQTAIQSLPRELSLPADGVLRIKPLRELEKLRCDEKDEGDITVKGDSSHMLKQIAGDTVELSVTVKPSDAKEYGVSVFCDKDGNGFPITIMPESKALAMGKIKPPFELKKDEDLNLRVFLDKGMVEVFVNDRQAAVYMQPHDQQNLGISLFSKGGDIAANVKGWKMKSIYAGRSRPNVILIMTDDQGYGEVAAHGNPIIRTPNMDKLHAASVRLTDFHVDPTCSPTRSALLTGRYSTRAGVWHTINGRSMLHPDELTLAETFKANGYRTAMIGKWHLGDNYPCRPEDQGFEHVIRHQGGGVGNGPDYWRNDYFDDTFKVNGKWRKFDGYCTDVWFREATSYVEKNKDQPFFLYLATNAPHGPFYVDDEYSKPYEAAGVPKTMAKFYGMITNIDENLGRFRARLDELRLTENTLLIFMTDNGTTAGYIDRNSGFRYFNAGMRGWKGSQWDGGHRVPCYFYWPAGGLTGGRDVGVLSAHIDLLPTLVDLLGLEKPMTGRALDGVSLRPALLEHTKPMPQRTLFAHVQRAFLPPKWTRSAAMTERWRLIDGKQLYDIIADPGQKNDVAADHPEVVKRLRGDYEKWWTSLEPALKQTVRYGLGGAENPTTLASHDWLMPGVEQAAWHQSHVERGSLINGAWAVDVEQSGTYEITLYRWAPYLNKAMGIAEARIMLGKVDEKIALKPDATGATFRVTLPKGPAMLQTWLRRPDGKQHGAYYTRVRYVPATTANTTTGRFTRTDPAAARCTAGRR